MPRKTKLSHRKSKSITHHINFTLVCNVATGLGFTKVTGKQEYLTFNGDDACLVITVLLLLLICLFILFYYQRYFDSHSFLLFHDY